MHVPGAVVGRALGGGVLEGDGDGDISFCQIELGRSGRELREDRLKAWKTFERIFPSEHRFQLEF